MKVLVALLLISASVRGADIPRSEEATFMTGYGWKMPSPLYVERLAKLLNRFVAQVHGKGFRYLGVDEDFFHGHLLVEKVQTGNDYVLRPRAMLYHTQEEAYGAHWKEKNIDAKYDYLDATARNWIQWLNDDPAVDGLFIENARSFLDATRLDPKVFEGTKPVPVARQHYTIHGHKLDGKKLGFKPFGELQWEFHLCDHSNVTEYDQRRGPIEVELPSGDKVCLDLTTNTLFIDHDSWKKN